MSEIKLTADSGGGTTSLKAPSSTTSNADVVLKLPVADGSANQVLKTDGSGQLSFTSNAGTTINNNADNRVITGSGTASTLNGEANLTFSSSLLVSDGNGSVNVGGNYALLKRTSGTTNYIAAPNADAVLDISADETIRFGTVNTGDFNSTERMRIDSSGKVGISTASPAERLHVYESSGAAVIRLEPGHSNGQAFNILSTYGSAANTGNFSIRNESGSSFLDLQHNEGTPRMQVRNGTANVHAQIDADGIKFNGDTAAANGLDDYEEGTWTPDVVASSGSDSWTYRNTGWYTKIGRLVTVSFSLGQYNGNLSGAIYISNLPFTVGGDFRTYGGDIGFYDVEAPSNTIGYFMYIPPNATQAHPYWTISGGAGTPVTGGHLYSSNRTFFEGNITYTTA